MKHDVLESENLESNRVNCKAKRGVHGEQVGFKPPPDAKAAAPSGPDPHPGFTYHGGPVVRNPRVFAIFLGDWASAANQARATRLNQYLTDLVGSAYMNILSQYGCGSSGSFIGSVFIAFPIPQRTCYLLDGKGRTNKVRRKPTASKTAST